MNLTSLKHILVITKFPVKSTKGYSKKIQTDRFEEMSRGIEKRACGNTRGQLKKKWNFQWCSRKSQVEFPWVLVFELGLSKGCHTILQNFQGWKLVFSGISRGKVTNLKIPGVFSETYILSPLVMIASGIAQMTLNTEL